jgi:hypothetical protein
MSEKKKLLGEKCKEEAQEQEKFVDSIRLLASVMTGTFLGSGRIK